MLLMCMDDSRYATESLSVDVLWLAKKAGWHGSKERVVRTFWMDLKL